MEKLKIYLKSGHTIDVKCETWKFDYNRETLEYTGYTFTGLKKIIRFSSKSNCSI